MRRQRNDNGYALVVVALVMFVFLGFAALAVDIGVASSARTSAARAADAAALAGAFTFITNPNLTGDAMVAAVTARATNTATSNTIVGQAIEADNVTVVVDLANRRVTVTIAHGQDTFFANAIGRSETNISATGVAEAAHHSTGDKCTKPWFIANTALSTRNRVCDGSGAGDIGACNEADPELIIDPATREVTSFALSRLGTQFTIKPQNPSQAFSPGQFFAIRLGDSSGAQDYKTNINTCPADAVYCSEFYSSEPGNMVGPTKQGVCELICYDGSQNCNTCEKDIYVAIGEYQHPDGSIRPTSRSLAIAPVIEVCRFCTEGFPSGTESQQYEVIGFALVFLEDIQGNNVLARLINVTTCSSGSGGGEDASEIDPEETGPFSLPLRLVRVPAGE